MKSWYSIKALAADGQPAADGSEPAAWEISLFDEIGGWGVSAKEFISAFKAIPDDAPITLAINSPGGEVFDALAIYNVLSRARDRITGRVEGLAASAASLILMAAGRIEIPANAYLMIHNPINLVWGDYREMRDMADFLEKMHANLAGIYAARSGKSQEDAEAIMDAETWYIGAEAVDAGFADAVTAEQPVAAHLTPQELARFKKTPALLAAPQTPPAPESKAAPEPKPEPAPGLDAMAPEAIAAACAEAGYGKLAAPLIRSHASADAVAARIEEARSITALAQAAGRPADAEALILCGVAPEVARERLMAARAAEVPAINSHPSADGAAGADHKSVAALEKRLNPKNIFAARKAAHQAA